MRKRPARKLLIASLLALALVGLPSSVALADSTQCVGSPFPETATPPFFVVHGDLVVPPGAFCIIIGVVVYGSVHVMPGAEGFHSHNSFIRGSVLSPGPLEQTPPLSDIRILGSTVGGSVLIAGTAPGSAGAVCRSAVGGDVIVKNSKGTTTIGVGFPDDVCTDGNTVYGSIIVQDNPFSGAPPPIDRQTVNNNRVYGDVVVEGNTGEPISIFLNRISKTLKCQNNTPPPIGFLNTAEKKEGQCAAF